MGCEANARNNLASLGVLYILETSLGLQNRKNYSYVQTYDANFTSFLIAVKRADFWLLLGLLMGYCLLMSHAFNLDPIGDSKCRKHRECSDTLEDALCECLAFGS